MRHPLRTCFPFGKRLSGIQRRLNGRNSVASGACARAAAALLFARHSASGSSRRFFRSSLARALLA